MPALLDRDQRVRAVRSRDARFDGDFFTAVVTTGIYCRPSCPATTPNPDNMRFYPSAAAAQQAGFRACKRCRPDTTPGSPEWDVRADVVGRAMRLISQGIVDREGVGGLARHLGYSIRQLERQLTAELGAGPLALARAQRAQTARVLIESTALPFGEIAFASGFSSIRTFNDTIGAVYASTPGQLRSRAATPEPTVRGEVNLRLPFRQPLNPDNLFGHLAATSIPGVEEWRDGAFRRTLRLRNGPGVVSLRPGAEQIHATLCLSDMRDLQQAICLCRRLLDLDADPEAIDQTLEHDEVLGPLVRKAPGRRVPRTTNGAEFAVRAVLGQQVSTAAARTHAARLVTCYGDPVADSSGGLTHLFPEPEALRDIDPATLRMPQARRDTLHALATALAGGNLDLSAGACRDDVRAAMRALPGIGPWTRESVMMRALGDPDAFPASDLGLRQAATALDLPTTANGLTARAAAWQPWRAYAVQYLWATGDHAINRMPE